MSTFARATPLSRFRFARNILAWKHDSSCSPHAKSARTAAGGGALLPAPKRAQHAHLRRAEPFHGYVRWSVCPWATIKFSSSVRARGDCRITLARRCAESPRNYLTQRAGERRPQTPVPTRNAHTHEELCCAHIHAPTIVCAPGGASSESTHRATQQDLVLPRNAIRGEGASP